MGIDPRMYNSGEWWTPEDLRILEAERRQSRRHYYRHEEEEEEEQEWQKGADSDATGHKY